MCVLIDFRCFLSLKQISFTMFYTNKKTLVYIVFVFLHLRPRLQCMHINVNTKQHEINNRTYKNKHKKYKNKQK